VPDSPRCRTAVTRASATSAACSAAWAQCDPDRYLPAPPPPPTVDTPFPELTYQRARGPCPIRRGCCSKERASNKAPADRPVPQNCQRGLHERRNRRTGDQRPAVGAAARHGHWEIKKLPSALAAAAARSHSVSSSPDRRAYTCCSRPRGRSGGGRGRRWPGGRVGTHGADRGGSVTSHAVCNASRRLNPLIIRSA
jgi:hypothetical protein